MQRHHKIHIKGKKFTCDKYDYETDVFFNLKSHTRRHADITDSPYRCNVCDQHFRTPYEFEDHKNWHLGVRAHECKWCDATFCFRRHKFIHLHKAHPNWKDNEKRIMKFIKNDKTVIQKIFTCDQCGKTYGSPRTLRKHMKLHDPDQLFHCVTCDKHFSTSYCLKVHSRVHSGDKPFECHLCHKKFSQKSALTVHSATHCQERLHKCNKCYKTFRTKNNLQIHKKSCSRLSGSE